MFGLSSPEKIRERLSDKEHGNHSMISVFLKDIYEHEFDCNLIYILRTASQVFSAGGAGVARSGADHESATTARWRILK